MTSEIETEPALRDQVLVEVQLDEHPVGLRAVVVNVQPGAIWLGLVRPNPLLERIRRNEPVRVTFRRDNAALVGDATFLAHLGSSRQRLFSVSRPANAQLVQRRAHLRADVERAIDVRVVSHGDSGSAGRSGSGRTRNICGSGLLFATDLELACHDQLEVTLTLASNDVAFAEAEVLRVDPIADAAIPRPGGSPPRWLVAVRFLAISEVDQDRIVRHVFSLIRPRRDERKAS